jgi:NAD(P)-dependent dehydrogenase (short-subunit alcohol dehydrogenase family)
MTESLAGKVALVTGGASGIGAATAQRLADEGCRVVVADVQTELGEKHAADIGGRFITLDVGDAVAWAAAVDDVVATEGGLDIAYLNAGVVTGEGDLTKLTDEQYARILGVNINGVLFGARAVSRAMAGSGGGSIVATASVAGLIGFSPDPIYTMTKHAVVGLIRALGMNLAVYKITANAICPGVVDTPLVGEARTLLEGMGYPLIPPSQIADAVVTAVQSGRTGECWVCLPNKPAEVHVFADVDLIRPGV